jgi:hypothetical protein
MISAHQGLRSVGIVLALGVACCLAVAVILVPPLLVIVAKYQPASLEPIPIRTSSKGSDEKHDGSDDSSDGKSLSRKERRRQAA